MANVRIKDVAAYARVSPATVSRVLNANPTVDEELRERVMNAINALGYHPSRAARRLRKKSHDVIGLIVSDIQNPHFVSLIKGAEEAAYINQMNLLLCNTGEDSDRLNQYLRVMRAESVAGMIVVPTSDHDALALCEIQEANIPVVILDRIIEGFGADVVRSDNEHGAYMAIEHLIGHGYRRIAIIQPDVKTGYERYNGYIAALKDHGIPFDPSLVKVEGHQIENSYRLTKELLGSANPPEAIFTATNLMTIGAFRAIHELGARVPHDVALIGFDEIPWADALAIPITTVAQPTYDLGQVAVDVLIKRLAERDTPYIQRNLPTRLIIRSSCGLH